MFPLCTPAVFSKVYKLARKHLLLKLGAQWSPPPLPNPSVCSKLFGCRILEERSHTKYFYESLLACRQVLSYNVSNRRCFPFLKKRSMEERVLLEQGDGELFLRTVILIIIHSVLPVLLLGPWATNSLGGEIPCITLEPVEFHIHLEIRWKHKGAILSSFSWTLDPIK